MNKISYFFLTFSFGLFAQESDKIVTKFSGFLETFYSYNSAEPSSQASLPFLYNYNRHNEFNVNIALIKGRFTYQNLYAKIGIQQGTYVTDNYTAESIKLLNEAYLGIKLTEKASLEVGILPSYIGFETGTSHSNLTLTRSILAENSPYYVTGIKYNSIVSKKFNFSIILSNGWQHIEKSNRKALPALGTQLVYKPTEKATFNWSTFLGDEPINNQLKTRFFNNLYIDYQWYIKFRTIVGFDYGLQKNNKNKFKNWLSPVFIGQYSIDKKWQTAFRTEYYEDAENLLIATEKPFKVFSSSLNLDFLPNDKAKIRTELRYLNPTEDLIRLEKNTFLWTTSFSFEF